MKRLPVIVTGIIFLLLVTQKLQLGLVRYFDADELAYLHWAHNVSIGQVPYRDFLLYVPPVFLWVTAPLFFLVHGTAILSASRVFAWIVFAGICIVTGILFAGMRGKTLFNLLLPGVFLSVIAIPSDKFLEFRPDNLAMLLGLIGAVWQLRALSGRKRSDWLWAGVWYGVSLLILPKMLPMVAAACFAALFATNSAYLFLGIAAPFVGFAVWSLGVGDIPHIWYSLTTLPFEVNKLGNIYPIMPYQFFYPNSTFYGSGGWNIGLLTNHALWIGGLVTGSLRLVTPYLPHGKNGVRAEIVAAGSLVVFVLVFLYGYPMRHEQYLIPIAVFVALYLADAADAIRRTMPHGVFSVVFAVCLLLLYRVDQGVTGPKFTLTNAEDYRVLAYAITTIPKDAYVFDLVGATVYFRDPYYVSAVPFGQWEPFLSRPLPSFANALEATRTRYIYEGRLDRIATLSQADRQYILSGFTPEGFAGFFVRSN